MGGYTQSSYGAASTRSKKQWNPSKVLGIVNMDSRYQCITCIGYAPTPRRRCQNPIRIDNRARIADVLDEMSYLNPGSPAVMSRLREIVGPALCVRDHQNQAESVLKEWQWKIRQLNTEMEEQRPTKPVQSSKKQDFLYDQPAEDLHEEIRITREFLAKLQEELDSQRHQNPRYKSREEKVTNDRQEEEPKDGRRQERDRKTRSEDKERLEKERLEGERLEKARKEKEEKKRCEQDQSAYNERIRQRAQNVREEREREKRKREQKERVEWDAAWTNYQERWKQFRASATREGEFRDTVPWPVRSGSYRDVTASSVRMFLQRAVPADANMARLMRKECQKWHPDMISRLSQGSQLADVDRMMVDMICRVVTDLLNDSARRSAEFLG